MSLDAPCFLIHLFFGVALLSIFIYWNLVLQDEIKKRKNAQEEILGQKCNSTCYAEISDERYQEILATLEENNIWTGETKNKSKVS